MKTKNLIDKYFLFIPILLFVFSLFNHTFCTDGGCATGINNLFFGAIGFNIEFIKTITYPLGELNGHNEKWNLVWNSNMGATFSWLANPLFFLALILTKKGNYRLGIIYSAISILMSISFMFFDKVLRGDGTGSYVTINNIMIGYWLWLIALLSLFLFLIYRINISKTTYNTV